MNFFQELRHLAGLRLSHLISYLKLETRQQQNLKSLGKGFSFGAIMFCLVACQRSELNTADRLDLTNSDQISPPPQIRLEPLPQDAQIQVYFNQNEANRYTDPYRQFERSGDDLEAQILGLIQSAQSSVDVAVQEFRLPQVAQALIAKQRSGVKVRVIIENTYNFTWQDLTAKAAEMNDRERSRYADLTALLDTNQDQTIQPAEIQARDAIAMLRAANVPLIDDTADGSKGSGLMHHKFVVVDGQRSIMTSANFTLSDVHGDFNNTQSRGNSNNLLVIQNLEFAALLTAEFNRMWGDGVGGKTDSLFGVKKGVQPLANLQIGNSLVTVKFSPAPKKTEYAATTNGLITAALSRSQASIDLALFVFSEQPIADVMNTRHRQGVTIRALIDPQFAFRDYSEALDMLGVTLPNRKCQPEANNAPWNPPIASVGTPNLMPGDVLHHKFGLVDDRVVITGSHNWSVAANSQNDELLVVLQNPTIAAHYKREFERLYRSAQLGIPPKVSTKLANPCSTANPTTSNHSPTNFPTDQSNDQSTDQSGEFEAEAEAE